MILEKVDWKPLEAVASFYTDVQKIEPPAFGFSIGWVEPQKWWKPYVNIQFWLWRVSIGWVYG